MRKYTMIIGLAILALALTAPVAWSTERDPSVPSPQTSGDDGGWDDPATTARDPRSVRPWRYHGDDVGWDDPQTTARDSRGIRPWQRYGDDSGWQDMDDSAIDDPETTWRPGKTWSIWMTIENAIGGRMIP
jgi:hypothetical protein